MTYVVYAAVSHCSETDGNNLQILQKYEYQMGPFISSRFDMGICADNIGRRNHADVLCAFPFSDVR